MEALGSYRVTCAESVRAHVYAYVTRRDVLRGKRVTVREGHVWSTEEGAWPRILLNLPLASAHPDEEVARAAEHLARRGARRAALVSVEMADQGPLWAGHGAVRTEQEYGMALPLARLGVLPPTRLSVEVRPVTTADGLDATVAVMAAGRGRAAGEYFRGIHGGEGFHDGFAQHFVAWRGDVPVATATLCRAAGVAGVWWVTVSPEHRRLGLGRLVTHAALTAAREAGDRLAVLESAPALAPLYRGLGFQVYCRVCVYRWARPVPPAQTG